MLYILRHYDGMLLFHREKDIEKKEKAMTWMLDEEAFCVSLINKKFQICRMFFKRCVKLQAPLRLRKTAHQKDYRIMSPVNVLSIYINIIINLL